MINNGNTQRCKWFDDREISAVMSFFLIDDLAEENNISQLKSLTKAQSDKKLMH